MIPGKFPPGESPPGKFPPGEFPPIYFHVFLPYFRFRNNRVL